MKAYAKFEPKCNSNTGSFPLSWSFNILYMCLSNELLVCLSIFLFCLLCSSQQLSITCAKLSCKLNTVYSMRYRNEWYSRLDCLLVALFFQFVWFFNTHSTRTSVVCANKLLWEVNVCDVKFVCTSMHLVMNSGKVFALQSQSMCVSMFVKLNFIRSASFSSARDDNYLLKLW